MDELFNYPNLSSREQESVSKPETLPSNTTFCGLRDEAFNNSVQTRVKNVPEQQLITREPPAESRDLIPVKQVPDIEEERIPGATALLEARSIMLCGKGTGKQRLAKAEDYFRQALGATEQLDLKKLQTRYAEIERSKKDFDEIGGASVSMSKKLDEGLHVMDLIKQPGKVRLEYARALNSVALESGEEKFNERAVAILKSLQKMDSLYQYNPTIQGALKILSERPFRYFSEADAQRVGEKELANSRNGFYVEAILEGAVAAGTGGYLIYSLYRNCFKPKAKYLRVALEEADSKRKEEVARLQRELESWRLQTREREQAELLEASGLVHERLPRRLKGALPAAYSADVREALEGVFEANRQKWCQNTVTQMELFIRDYDSQKEGSVTQVNEFLSRAGVDAQKTSDRSSEAGNDRRGAREALSPSSSRDSGHSEQTVIVDRATHKTSNEQRRSQVRLSNESALARGTEKHNDAGKQLHPMFVGELSISDIESKFANIDKEIASARDKARILADIASEFGSQSNNKWYSNARVLENTLHDLDSRMNASRDLEHVLRKVLATGDRGALQELSSAEIEEARREIREIAAANFSLAAELTRIKHERGELTSDSAREAHSKQFVARIKEAQTELRERPESAHKGFGMAGRAGTTVGLLMIAGWLLDSSLGRKAASSSTHRVLPSKD